MIINVNRIPTITIGYLGENIVTEITFNYSQWKALYGEGTLSLTLKRNGDTLAYPIFLEHEIGTYESTWIVTNTDVAKVGVAEAQLTYVVNGEAVKKSEIFTVNVKNSLENGETPPDPYQSWLDEVYEVADEMAQTKESMIDYVDDKQTEINHSVELAEEYKDSASNSASAASGYAQTAKSHSDSASSSATQANGYAEDAQIYANNASIYASNASGFANYASGYANNASASATEAERQSELASEYAEDAQASAEQAEQSAEIFDDLANATLIERSKNGAIASFSDGADFDVKELIADIDAVQDLHGESNPYPAGGGINQWDEEWEAGGLNTSGGDNNNSSVVANNIRSKNYIRVLPNVSYYSYCGTSVYRIRVAFYDENKTNLGGTVNQAPPFSFTTPNNCAYIRFSTLSDSSPYYGNTYKNDISINYPSTDTAYHPYSNICPISGWNAVNVNVSGVNQWDEEWEVGDINNSGIPTTGSFVRSKNYIHALPNTTYYWSIPNNNQGRVFYYDAEKNFINYGFTSNSMFTTPSNCHYVKFRTASGYGTTYKNDISINYPSTDTEYHAYNGKSYTTAVNVWDEETIAGGYYDSTGTWVTNAHILSAKNHIPVFPNTKYYVSTSQYVALTYWDADKNFIQRVSTQKNTIFTTPSNCHYLLFNLVSDYGTTYNHDISINFPATAISYIPYKGAEATANYMDSFGRGIYGGKLNVTTGELTITHGYVDLGTLPWAMASGYTYNRFNTSINGKWFPPDYKSRADGLICSKYIADGSGAISGNVDKAISGYQNSGGIYITDSAYSTAAAFKSAMSGVQLVYKLATPTTVQLTPTEVKSLLGQNNIWADSGNVDVTYRASASLVIEQLTNAIISLGGNVN